MFVREEKKSLVISYDKPLSCVKFHKKLIRKEIKVVDYVQYFLTNYEKYEEKINAFVQFNKEALLEEASKLDYELSLHIKDVGKKFNAMMYGVPVAVKDIFNTIDMPTERGSPIYKNYTPGNDARVVTDIRRSSGIVYGKTDTAEFAVHHPGKAKNPLRLSCTPGSSSGGSAAAVAAGMVPLALSSQTDGSTIRPASYCGVIGFKPSFGVLPRTAMLKTTDTLDTVAIIGAHLVDIRQLFNTLRVTGPNYPIVEKKLRPFSGKPEKLKIGYLNSHIDDYQSPSVSSEFSKHCSILKDQGLDIKKCQLPDDLSQSKNIHTLIYHKALSYYFKREWEQSPHLFSRSLKLIIEEGRSITANEYHMATKKQVEILHVMDRLFNDFDILICPSSAIEAPGHDDRSSILMPLDYNHLVTMSHCPSITLPLMKGQSGLPLGLQFFSKKYTDYMLFDFCRYIEGLYDKSTACHY